MPSRIRLRSSNFEEMQINSAVASCGSGSLRRAGTRALKTGRSKATSRSNRTATVRQTAGDRADSLSLSLLFRPLLTVAREIGDERRDLKRLLIPRGNERHVLGLDQIDAVGPWIDLDSRAEGQGRNLVEIFFFQFWRSCHQLGHAKLMALFDQAIAEV